MPSRRQLLRAVPAATLAAVAGCTNAPGSGTGPTDRGSPTGTPTDGSPASPTDSATDTTDTPADPVADYAHVAADDLSTDATALVVSSAWRDWLRTAADGATARGSVKPEDCGRSPLEDLTAVRLVDAGERSGGYRVDGETGGYFEYPLEAERADPPADAEVYRYGDLPSPVRERFGQPLDGERIGLPPQNRPYQFFRANGRAAEDAHLELWVRRDGTTYRLFSRFPTITPPCGYYVVLRLAADDGVDGPGLSLASLGGGMETIAADAEAERSRALSEYPEAARDALRRADYVMTVREFFRVQVRDG